eukprot:1187843-Rhodomonas_salina.2
MSRDDDAMPGTDYRFDRWGTWMGLTTGFDHRAQETTGRSVMDVIHDAILEFKSHYHFPFTPVSLVKGERRWRGAGVLVRFDRCQYCSVSTVVSAVQFYEYCHEYSSLSTAVSTVPFVLPVLTARM